MRIREVVVAAAIVGTTVCLAIPTVQKLREASQRARCVNNLRQIGTACHSYHNLKRRLPPGGNNTPPSKSASPAAECRETEWSWAYHLLPHLGHSELHRDPNPGTVCSATIPTYWCPNRRRGRGSSRRGHLDYAANAGTRPTTDNGAILRTSDGSVSLGDFTDGIASTVLIGEKRLNVAELGNHPGDREGYATPGWSDNFEAHRLGSSGPAPDLQEPGNLEPLSEFGSSHPGIFNAVFADGSVRTIRYSINPTTWRRACGRNDNQNFNLNEL